ncbi:TGS domain-containing protein [Candidatus Pacearchaeota archaeon]|nr:TGS domain-containing protein [Candidatus Pacearchaeota archaeon]
MASTNQSPAYLRAHGEYLNAETTEQKIRCLKKMLSLSPKHKGAENMNAQLKRRLAKLKYTKIKEDKSGKSSFKGIKKEEMQAVIVGNTNVGKSSLLSAMTNAQPKISEHKFTTTQPIIGMTPFSGTHIQLIENPAIESEYYDRGLTNTADVILILVNTIEQIAEIEKALGKSYGKRIIVFNNKDKLDERKVKETLKSKKYNFIILSKDNLEELKEKIFKGFGKIRVFTKEPHKGKTTRPMILKPNSTVEDIAEKILKGFSKKVKTSKIWGPSSKFSGQQVGMKHKLKDLDVVEFKTG